VLAKNFRVAQETFDDIPLHNLWIFPGDEPGDLEADQVAAGVEWGSPTPAIFRLSESKPVYENSGDDDLVFIETFRSDRYEEVSLANWLAHLPPKLVSAHLNIPGDTLAKFPKGAQGIVPV
jgi:oxalate decarboxylase/phosphoglucose isomerase-like protein (cupin superfamily)